jgi:leader peptidase (prepilin peptidase) / N-methyltransferase
MMDLAVVIGAAVLGVLVGPLLVLLVDRVPAMAHAGAPSPELSTMDPASRDRVVRLLAPVVLALAGARWGASLVVVPFLLLFAVLLVVSVIDLEHYRIPDRIVFPALAMSVPLIVVVTVIEGFPGEALRNALIGAVVYFGLLLIPHLVYPKGLGFGDVKLGLLMGLYLGWMYFDVFQAVSLVMWALVIGSGLGSLIGVGYAVLRRRRAEFPFGPALAAGCILAVLFSERLVG